MQVAIGNVGVARGLHLDKAVDALTARASRWNVATSNAANSKFDHLGLCTVQTRARAPWRKSWGPSRGRTKFGDPFVGVGCAFNMCSCRGSWKYRMKAGGGKAAFRQTFIFSYEAGKSEKYDAVALSKFPYIDKWMIYSQSQLPSELRTTSCLVQDTLWNILLGDSKELLCSGKATLRLNKDASGDNVSIDNGILRLDLYRHRFFELGLVKRHWSYICKWSPHKKTGDYPRMYLQIPLPAFLEEKDVAERVCRVLLEKNPDMTEWDLANGPEVTPVRLHMKSVVGPNDKVSLEDDQGIYDFVNSFSTIEGDGNIYAYKVEGALENASFILNDPNVLLVEGRSSGKAVVSYVDEQHPLVPSRLHEPARIYFIRPQCVQEGRCVTLCYA